MLVSPYFLFCFITSSNQILSIHYVQINALREEDLNDAFFKALARVQEIHANCKILLRTHHQVGGDFFFLVSSICG